MKKFLKNNYLVIIIFIICIFLGYFYLFGEFKSIYLNSDDINNAFEMMCQSDEMKTSKECQNYFINGPYEDAERDVLFIFYYLFDSSPLRILSFTMSFLISLVSLKKISTIFNNGQTKLYLTREKYSVFIKKMLLNSLKYIFLFPIIFIILYLGCLWLGKGNFDVSYLIDSSASMIPYQYASLGPWFIVLFTYSLIINVIIYILLGLISLRIVNNYYVSVIISYILFLVMAISGEIFGELIFYECFNIDIHNYLNFIGIFEFSDIPNYYLYTGIRILIIFILTGIIYLLYRNKEKLINYTEKKWEILK